MKPKYKWLLFSFIFLLSMIGLIVISQHSESAGQDKSEKELVSFFADPEQVQKIIINDSISLSYERQGWKVEEVNEETDQLKIEQTVNHVLSLQGELIDEKIEHSGLENPWMTIETIGTEGGKVTVNIGERNENDNFYYASIEGNSNIYKVESMIIDSIPTSAENLIDNRIVEIRPDSLEEIIIYNGKQTIALKPESPFSEQESLTNLSGWYMHEPYQGVYSVKYNQMSEMIYGVDLLQKLEVVEEREPDLSTYGLDNVDFYITFKGGGIEEKLLIGKPATNQSYYAKLESKQEIITIPREAVKIYSYQAFDLVEKFVGIYALDVIQSIEIKSDGKEIQIDNENGNFQIDETMIDDGTFRDLYKKIAGLSVHAEVDKEAFNSPKATIEYTIDLGDEQKEILIEFMEYDKDNYVVVKDGLADFLVNKNKFQEMINEINQTKDMASM